MNHKQLHQLAILCMAFFFNLNFVFPNPLFSESVMGIKLNIRVHLKGPLLYGGNSGSLLMGDDLRQKGYLPLEEPYTAFPRFNHVGADGGGETVANKMVFEQTGADAIVDWLFIELRDAADSTKVIATRSALLQRDGDVVGMNGHSSVHFASMPMGEYYVAVRHRNHLGVMTGEPYELGAIPQTLDFTDPAFPTYGTNAQAKIAGRMAMHAGNFNQDRRVIAIGPGNDVFSLFSAVLSAEDNTMHLTNYILKGYSLADLDLDGEAIYNGAGNERTKLFYHVLGNCLNNGQPNCILVEQLP